MITRSPSLTDQVKAHLKERIVNGGFAGGRIPPEAALAEELGVSRTTVRDALAKLENEGAIFRKQGAGTFVNAPGLQIKSRLEDIWSYERVLEENGYTPSVRVLRDAVVPADAAAAEALDIAEGSDVIEIEKLFLENSTPVILTINRIPVDVVAVPDQVRDELPIYDFLDEYSDRRLSYYVSEIVPAAFGAPVARHLAVPRGTVGLAFVETGYDQANLPIVYATSFFRDDLLRFRVIRRRSGA